MKEEAKLVCILFEFVLFCGIFNLYFPLFQAKEQEKKKPIHSAPRGKFYMHDDRSGSQGRYELHITDANF